jgi:hypothetical protein
MTLADDLRARAIEFDSDKDDFYGGAYIGASDVTLLRAAADCIDVLLQIANYGSPPEASVAREGLGLND